MKPRILGIGSESYPEGRIDSFRIDEENGAFEVIVSCLIEFGFSEESIRTNIDLALEDRGYLFLYLNPNLKLHLSAEESGDFFTIRFDTSLKKENIISLMKKYFQFPE
jgi:hypothetical protein